MLVKATAVYRPLIMNVLNVGPFNLQANSTASWGNTRLRVALVLDNTESMGQAGKLPALQTATKNLINQLKNAATATGDVYVSIVPFVRDVKVDPVTNASASWIECGDAGDNRQDLTCTNIKNAGIRIYAIQVNTSSPPDPTPTLLQNCATRPSSFG